MEEKQVRARVIVVYTSHDGREMYAAGYIDGYGGSDVIVVMPMGRHLFRRDDGTWLEGDCLNYKDARIMDIGDVDASIRAGFFGDVAAHQKDQNTPKMAVPMSA